jgi:hypothetical protein
MLAAVSLNTVGTAKAVAEKFDLDKKEKNKERTFLQKSKKLFKKYKFLLSGLAIEGAVWFASGLIFRRVDFFYLKNKIEKIERPIVPCMPCVAAKLREAARNGEITKPFMTYCLSCGVLRAINGKKKTIVLKKDEIIYLLLENDEKKIKELDYTRLFGKVLECGKSTKSLGMWDHIFKNKMA